MVASARRMEAAANAILEADRREYVRLMNISADQTLIKKAMKKAENAEAIIQWVLQCRRHEKNFQVRKEEIYFTKVNSILDKITAMGEKSRQIIQAADEYRKAFSRYKELKDSQNEINNTMVTCARKIQGSVKACQVSQQQKTDRQIVTAKRLILGVSLLAFVLGIGTAVFIKQSVLSQLGSDPAELADITNNIANGNLAVNFDPDKKNEGVYKDMKHMVGNLSHMLKDITNSVQTLTAASTQLSSISEQITANSEQTAERSNNVSVSAEEMAVNMTSVAAATEQTTVSIQMIVSAAEEMTATINEISGNTAKGSSTTSKSGRKSKTGHFKGR